MIVVDATSSPNTTNHILARTQTTDTLRVKLAATVIVARQRLSTTPHVLTLSELGTGSSDNVENRIEYLFGGKKERSFGNGWELLLGQSEVQNHLRSTPQHVSLMRYGGEFKFAGGSVDHNETLEQAARRELSEEFLCTVPKSAKLRLFDVKQTRPVQNTSYIMHNFVCLETENEWLHDMDVSKVNHALLQRRQRFHNLKASGAFYKMNKAEKETVCPEVHAIEWLNMKTAVARSFTSMNADIQYVNDYQRHEFERLNVKHRDPLFITMTVMTALDRFSSIDDIVQFTDQFDGQKERENIQWLSDGMEPHEVQQIMQERSGHHPGAGVHVVVETKSSSSSRSNEHTCTIEGGKDGEDREEDASDDGEEEGEERRQRKRKRESKTTGTSKM